ncbi:hypothetical protein C8N40_103256 [Pontibacter mucosus]|uniref:Uncharacterized protein n=1 Tax=Pontibacter mucosus TaxID=1649266 RepID=A0A2T5YLL5_9BACT|nr:DUF6544 family protein [Pontibacter mucosus]PTX20181.1 hypothetical protein C8N40_103256 [Pontibacter mucosus]
MSLKNLFETEVRQALAQYSQQLGQETVTPEALAPLPAAVQGYLSSCGYVGKPRIRNFFVEYDHAQIKLNPAGEWLNLRCMQFNSVAPATRLALMQAKMYDFVPFGARDEYQHGQGNMLIKLAGLTISNARGPKMDQAALVTFLAEAPLLPGLFFQQHTTWQALSPGRIGASITDAGITVGGAFQFNGRGEITSFRTRDRYYSTDGKSYQNWEWSALLDRYRPLGECKIPTVVRAVWHMPGGHDYEYFRASIKSIKYNLTGWP